ncbi:MAG: biotin/lipoyl-containing protein, partial [Paracoccaceae bacterium]
QEIRDARISGTMDNHEREVGTDWVISLGGQDFAVTIEADREGATVRFSDGPAHRVTSDWVPGVSLAHVDVNGEVLVIRVDRCPGGYRLRHRGADLRARVQTPRIFELSRHMIEKTPPDTSRFLLCPMPGMVVSLAVTEGDEVEAGQTLCTIEAMKMENVLKAGRRGVVSKINAAPGDSLAVDAVIMEFL